MKINNILITGCGSGLGYELALVFSKLNCKVYAVSRNQSSLKSLSKLSSNICGLYADITHSKDREIIKSSINENKVSIIHNAALAVPQKFENLTEDILRQQLEVNLLAPLLLTRELLTKLKDQRVLFLSSGAADLALPGLLPYCISKGALEQATECLQKEFLGDNVYFAKLRPGIMDTPMMTGLRTADIQDLPGKQYYIDVWKNKKLSSANKVAEFVAKVMLNTSNAEFTSSNWDFKNA